MRNNDNLQTPATHAELAGRIWLNRNGAGFLGRGRIRLLEIIADTGSINQAAKAMKMSYRTAWFAVNAMNNLAERPIVTRSVGGRDGGGTTVTEEGLALIRRFRALEKRYAAFLESLKGGLEDLEQLDTLLGRKPVRVSARNQLRGTIKHIDDGTIHVHVHVDIGGEDSIVALVTRTSAEDLELAPGAACQVLIKAPLIAFGPGSGEENNLRGTVAARLDAGKITEVGIVLAGGRTLVATMGTAECKTLLPELGQEVIARFNASDVLIGLEA